MSIYNYLQLPAEQDPVNNPPWTRLLLLSPGSKDTEILHGSLHVVNIDDPPRFEALSYTWGTGPPQTWLSCSIGGATGGGGGVGGIWMRESLAAALRCLRLPTQARWLWVDAICINQDDVYERTRQVQYMKHIYQKAARAIVWLGHKADGVEEAFTLAMQIAEARGAGAHAVDSKEQPVSKPDECDQNPTLRTRMLKGAITWLAQRQRESGKVTMKVSEPHIGRPIDYAPFEYIVRNPQAAQCLRRLFERPYFRRIWCVQEVLVSSHLIAFCDDLEIDFMVILACAIYILAHYTDSCPGQPFEFWNCLYQNRTGEQRLGRVEGSIGPILIALQSSRDFQASDPRDKIFSLLAITDEGINPALSTTRVLGNHNPEMIRTMQEYLANTRDRSPTFGPFANRHRNPALMVDYTKDVVQVYRDFTRFMIRASPRLLEILSQVFHLGDPAEGPFPSWVPKWFQPRSASVLSCGIYNAGLGKSVRRHFACLHDMPLHPLHGKTRHPALLQLDGFYVDRVRTISDVMYHSTDKTPNLRTIWAQIIDVPFAFPTHLSYLNQESVELAFHQALTAGLIGLLGVLALSSPNIMHSSWEDIEHYARLDAEAAISTLSKSSQAPCIASVEVQGSPSSNVNPTMDFSNLPTLSIDERAARWQNSVRSSSHNRRVYLTEKGRLGLGPMMMRPGDEVCVLFGGRLPFILRSQPSGHHVLVGDTYLHDGNIMNGSHVESVLANDSEFSNVTFEIE